MKLENSQKSQSRKAIELMTIFICGYLPMDKLEERPKSHLRAPKARRGQEGND
jgi:hypothetical protein